MEVITLFKLPKNLLFYIFSFLKTVDLNNLSESCKSLLFLSKEKKYWQTKFKSKKIEEKEIEEYILKYNCNDYKKCFFDLHSKKIFG